MKLIRHIALALLSFTIPPNLEIPSEEPLARGTTTAQGPLSPTWTTRRATITASRVRLNGLGARTHANWVLFRLPFDTRQRDRIRSVRFVPHASTETEVGALRIGSVCVLISPYGDVTSWSMYTVSGMGYTERFGWHLAPPTTDPTILGINVPTRVANYAACGESDERIAALHLPGTWKLDVDWEER